jgi:hypothetical protein
MSPIPSFDYSLLWRRSLRSVANMTRRRGRVHGDAPRAHRRIEVFRSSPNDAPAAIARRRARPRSFRSG